MLTIDIFGESVAVYGRAIQSQRDGGNCAGAGGGGGGGQVYVLLVSGGVCWWWVKPSVCGSF